MAKCRVRKFSLPLQQNHRLDCRLRRRRSGLPHGHRPAPQTLGNVLKPAWCQRHYRLQMLPDLRSFRRLPGGRSLKPHFFVMHPPKPRSMLRANRSVHATIDGRRRHRARTICLRSGGMMAGWRLCAGREKATTSSARCSTEKTAHNLPTAARVARIMSGCSKQSSLRYRRDILPFRRTR